MCIRLHAILRICPAYGRLNGWRMVFVDRRSIFVVDWFGSRWSCRSLWSEWSIGSAQDMLSCRRVSFTVLLLSGRSTHVCLPVIWDPFVEEGISGCFACHCFPPALENLHCWISILSIDPVKFYHSTSRVFLLLTSLTTVTQCFLRIACNIPKGRGRT